MLNLLGVSFLHIKLIIMNKIKYILFTAFIFVACSESESIEDKVTMLVTTNVRGQLDPCG